MTTAARPTWAPAQGSEEQGGRRTFGPSKQVSSRDLPGQLTNKVRREGQGTADEVRKKDLRAELEEREQKHRQSKGESPADLERKRKEDLLLIGPGNKEKEEKLVPKAVDADDDDDEPSESEDESDEEEDDTAELLAELERIKKEREAERLRKEREELAVNSKMKEEDLLRGNPLLGQGVSFAVKRRWDDDVVFKNQTRGEPKQQKRFINDTIRNDFHRKFLNKYVK
ncbi:putative Cwf15/Cwc15 cell cycle control protein [Klebsormidium nitens]|uniref:Putative Cwf15/Cwc15 cell cycle control protein n=1 Tax=Klebsormidium nitens TaxID=105231 RepID=A0A1Y1I607_KLENI|nr:putative Cwf15/Cwc15 cell cycle control protein [Klebsormidium nitens]|eukprot:GAQ86394.1 putative Cwf15/Cwc15 cell cycle control protein [Klebsormidium nitens]